MLVHGSFLQPSPTLPSLLFIRRAATRFLQNSKNFPRDKAFDKLRNTPIIIVAGIKSYTSFRTTVWRLFFFPSFLFFFFCFFWFSLWLALSMVISLRQKCRESFPKSIRFGFDFLTDSMEVDVSDVQQRNSGSPELFGSRVPFGIKDAILLWISLWILDSSSSRDPFVSTADGTRKSSSVFVLRWIKRPTLTETRRKEFETPARIRLVRNRRNSTQQTHTTTDVSEWTRAFCERAKSRAFEEGLLRLWLTKIAVRAVKWRHLMNRALMQYL